MKSREAMPASTESVIGRMHSRFIPWEGMMPKVVEVEIPDGEYCRVWGSIHCIFNEDVTTGDAYGICRYLEALCGKDEKGQCKKHPRCPSIK